MTTHSDNKDPQKTTRPVANIQPQRPPPTASAAAADVPSSAPINYARLLLLSLLALLTWLLSMSYSAHKGGPLNDDLPSFFRAGREAWFFYNSGLREPVHPWVLHLLSALTHSSEQAARLSTVLYTLIAAVVLYCSARQWFGRTTALIATLLFAINPVVIYYGVSGLRAPLYTAELLLIAALLSHPLRYKRPWQLAVTLSAALSLASLTRMHAWLFVLGAVLIMIWEDRLWKAAKRPWLLAMGLALLAAIIVYAPYPLLNGDGASSTAVNFWRNVEQTGKPGTFLSDPRISTWAYVFENRSLFDVVIRVSKNYYLFVRQYIPQLLGFMAPLAWLIPIGLWRSWIERRVFLLFFTGLSLVQVVFILNVNQMSGVRGIETRFVYQALPFVLLYISLALAWLGQITSTRLRYIFNKLRSRQ